MFVVDFIKLDFLFCFHKNKINLENDIKYLKFTPALKVKIVIKINQLNFKYFNNGQSIMEIFYYINLLEDWNWFSKLYFF